MNTPSEEIQEDGNGRRKSISSGSKTRRYSIGVTSSRKSIGEERNIVPNYLRASTGSCHDFCKYGKKHEHSKSPIPVKFKRTPIVNKEKLTKTVAPVERKKTTVTKLKSSAEPIEVTKKDVELPSKKPQVLKRILSTNGKSTENEPKVSQRSTSRVKPSPVMVNPDGPARSNGGIIKKEVKIVKKGEITPKTAVIKKVAIESQSSKASLSRAANLKEIKHKSVKKVSPSKDKNRLLKTEPKQSDKVLTNTSHGIEPESELKLENIDFDLIHPASESFSGKNIVEQKFIEAESEVKLENIKFDFIHPDSDSCSVKDVVEEEFVEAEAESEVKLENIKFDFIHPDSESFLGKNVVEEEFGEAESEVKLETMGFDFLHPTIDFIDPNSGKNVVEEELIRVDENSEVLDKKFVEETLIEPFVVENSESCSDKEVLEEELLIVPPVSESSESFYDEELVLEDVSEYTDDDDDDDENEVSEEEESETANNEETETSVNKFSRKGRKVISEEKDEEAVKLRFRRGKVIDLKSENNAPRRLKFRKGKVMEGKEVKQHVSRRSFEKKYVEERMGSQNAPESVVLKHQGEQGKKDAQGLFNNVIEETASKLAETRKSKVKALVGAFETVISLQDGKL